MGEMMFNSKGGILTIEGVEVSEVCEVKCFGMEEDRADSVKDYVKNNIQICKNTECQFVGRLVLKRRTLLKLMGLIDWAYDNCPNKRVRHLIKNGKNERVRYKNYKRACKLIIKEACSKS